MSLKQDIVVRNEFSVPLADGSGSRGATPGAYVTRYMSRAKATEPIAPIKISPVDEYIKRYMAREDAVESTTTKNVQTVKKHMANGVKDGGVAFGYGTFSLSDEQLNAASADIQRLFDSGHTVMKTVLSFTNDYLVKHNIVKPGFVPKRPGDYRGNVDQLKMRLAVMRGLERMGRAHYDDLRYVGTIQVDTNHLHVHLAMVDAGKGAIAPDGKQKGKLSQNAMSMLRRGIDAFLDEKHLVAHLSSAVGYERRNVISYVKRWAHLQVLRESLPQLLLATLPQDRRLWRYATNNKAMVRPNRIVRELVEEILNRPGSPMGSAMASVTDYANHRRQKEDLNEAQWAKLIDTGRERIIERGINAVYATLKSLPKNLLEVRTPVLDVMGMDYGELAELARDETQDDLVSFGYRLRSYAARLREHDAKRAIAQEQMDLWEKADQAGLASEQSRDFYNWWVLEEKYHGQCGAKYRHFLPPLAKDGPWSAQLNELDDYSQRLESLKAMVNDTSLAKMKDLDEAEEIGRSVYGQRGGRLVASKDAVSKQRLKDRIELMEAKRESQIRQLRADLAKSGRILALESTKYVVASGEEFDFDEVKGLDLHHMHFDFSRDVQVGVEARNAFLEMSQRRMEALILAAEYLEATGQEDVAEQLLDTQDVIAMDAMAKNLAAQDPDHTMLVSQIAKLAQQQKEKRSATIKLGQGLDLTTARVVEQEVSNFDPTVGIEAEVPPSRSVI